MIDSSVPSDIRDAAARLLADCGKEPLAFIEPIAGGRNNRVYRVAGASPEVGILKHYFRGPGDKRDRFASEAAWYQFCESENIRGIPRLWGLDDAATCILIAEIPGRKLLPDEASSAHVAQAIEFFAELNEHRQSPFATKLPPAADACFTVDAFLAGLAARIERLSQVAAGDEVSQQLQDWLAGPLNHTWSLVRKRIEQAFSSAERSRTLTQAERCLSPSDFGFHNAILDADGRLWFVDFEYAGWDDPAKTVCDFFWQVDVPAPRGAMPDFLDAVRPFGGDILRRAEVLFPFFGLQWATIVLNEFLRDGISRRKFARGHLGGEDARPRQLQIAQRLVDEVQALLKA